MAPVISLAFVLIVLAGLIIQGRCDDSRGYPPGPSADLSTVWTANRRQGDTHFYVDPLITRPVPGNYSLVFAAGFYWGSLCFHNKGDFYIIDDCSRSCIFGVYVAAHVNQSDRWMIGEPIMVVWSANRDHQVQLNATLNFTSGGDLVLQDADNSLVWSTNTSGQSVAGMTITDLGNLVLFDQNNRSVWQSFDHPTDTLLPKQPLLEGMTLRPNSSFTNWTASNKFYFAVLSGGLSAYVGSAQPQEYYALPASIGKNSYITLVNGSLTIFDAASKPQRLLDLQPLRASFFQCIRFESDGHLKVYELVANEQREMNLVAHNLIQLEYCDYPTSCGEYGICSRGQCSCPTAADAAYFTQIDYRTPNLGCVLETPISCQSVQGHRLIPIANVSYFYYNQSIEAELDDEESCKRSCLTTCSCRAAIFRYYGQIHGAGGCSLVTQVLSLKHPSTGGCF